MLLARPFHRKSNIELALVKPLKSAGIVQDVGYAWIISTQTRSLINEPNVPFSMSNLVATVQSGPATSE